MRERIMMATFVFMISSLEILHKPQVNPPMTAGARRRKPVATTGHHQFVRSTLPNFISPPQRSINPTRAPVPAIP
jgi:hypothetical protein